MVKVCSRIHGKKKKRQKAVNFIPARSLHYRTSAAAWMFLIVHWPCPAHTPTISSHTVGKSMLRGHFPPSGFFWKPLRCSWWYPMERRTQQWEGSNDSFQDLCPSVPKSVESMCWSIPSIGVLGSFTTLGFWGGLGYSRKEKVTYREESKREQEVYSLLQTYARFSQHAIWFELLLRWKKGSQEKTREGGTAASWTTKCNFS